MFKRRREYEIWYGLGGSGMCIREGGSMPRKPAALAAAGVKRDSGKGRVCR